MFDPLKVNVPCTHCYYLQMEWLTAGDCMAGMHEVVVTHTTVEAIKVAIQQNQSLWRVSSTVSFPLTSGETIQYNGYNDDMLLHTHIVSKKMYTLSPQSRGFCPHY